MPVDFIKYAFTAGELAENFLGRTDLEQYDFGLRLAENWFVDYRGGLTTRPGGFFADYVYRDDLPTKYFPFKYAPDEANTYLLLFGHEYIRFIQDGAYVLEDNVAISSITEANPGVVTAAGHGYADLDWVKIGGRTFQINVLTVNTFELQDPFGNAFSTINMTDFILNTVVARIYTVVTPYQGNDLDNIHVGQRRDQLRITTVDAAVRNLVRNDHADWTLSNESFGSPIGRVFNVNTTPSAAGSFGTVVCVTSVDADGNESIPGTIRVENNMVNYSAVAGALRITWNTVDDAIYYNVYRSLIVPSADASRSAEMGFIGRAYGATFTDNNIVPDFAKQPPQRFKPFANGSVYQINMTAGGAGHDSSTTVNVAGGGGTGFSGYPIVNAAGAVVGVQISAGGQNYSSPVVSFGGAGAGATAVAKLTPADGNYPSLNARFQQRQLYASTENEPLTVWGSQPGRYSNFDYSDIVLDSDSFDFELDADEVTPIRHMFAAVGGLLLFLNVGIWKLTGGGDNVPITPTNALAEPQTYAGVSEVEPIRIDNDVLYSEDQGGAVRMLSYNQFSNLYASKDISILSNHLFTVDKFITRWSYAKEPNKLIWATRSDGAMLTLTFVKDENVFAWTHHWTKGFVEDVLVIQEGRRDRVYLMVSRYINGRWTKFIEYIADRRFDYVEDSRDLDCGLATVPNYPATALTFDTVSGDTVTFTASSSTFVPGDVGSIIRAGGGKAEITGYVSNTVVTGRWLRECADSAKIPQYTEVIPIRQESGEWTLDAPFTTLSGLWHLEGQLVNVNADGNIVYDLEVVDGSVTLPNPATRAFAGLSFSCIARTLPLASTQAPIEARRKRIPSASLRLTKTNQLFVGRDMDSLYDIAERTTEIMGEPTNQVEGWAHYDFATDWTEDESTYFVQNKSLPAQILGLVPHVEVGDDPD